MSNRVFQFILALCFLALPKKEVFGQEVLNLASPNTQLELSFLLKKGYPQRAGVGQDSSCVFYRLEYKGQQVILDSQLGLKLAGAPTLISHFKIINHHKITVDEAWKPVYGERNEIPDRYNELKVFLKEQIYPYRYLNLVFRLYDEGLAFRYEVPSQATKGNFTIADEYSHFAFSEGTEALVNYDRMQTKYQRQPVEEIGKNAARPLAVRYKNGVYGAILEAGVINYPNMYLRSVPKWKAKNTLVSQLPSPARAEKLPFSTPWRVFMVSDSPGGLIENNYLISNLCPPSKVTETQWIKPGKIMREMSLSTVGGKKMVDFAQQQGLQYILFDGGWYGDPIVDQSKANQGNPWERKISNSIYPRGLDIKEVVDYAKGKNIGVFLYLDRRVLERQLDELLPLYKSWGIAGLKFGFVGWDLQAWNEWVYQLVEKCADYELMVNIHDEFYPTGLSRTYPNLLTQEGVFGNEEMPDAQHNVNLAFTRILAGATDYTPAYYRRAGLSDSKKIIQNTAAHQLALPVIYYSPLQILFWYDKPEDFQGEPEIPFWEQMPTVWEETKVLEAKWGEYIVIARRSAKEWYIGAITNKESREIELSFSNILGDGRYQSTIYTDGGSKVKTRTKVKVETLNIDAQSKINLKLLENGGAAILIKPIDNR